MTKSCPTLKTQTGIISWLPALHTLSNALLIATIAGLASIRVFRSATSFFQGLDWESPRRIVIVRQRIEERPKATGKQLSLFPEDEIHRNYRYSAYFTNQQYAATDVWRNYRARGDAENRIKELKEDFGADSFNLKGFFPTEAALHFVMIAYNLMSLFRIFVLQEKTQKRLSTLRYRTFAIGAYFEKVNDTFQLKIALVKKRRKWFAGLWDYPLQLNQKIPNV